MRKPFPQDTPWRFRHQSEQLFASGYSACFIAMKAVAGGLKLKVPNDCHGNRRHRPARRGGFGITADLAISLPGRSREDAERLVESAHQTCPYSNATRNNMDVGLTIL